MSVASVVREYGMAMRGDWSEVDGRSVRDVMDEIADWIESASYPGDEAARNMLGICQSGRGHWLHWCDSDSDCEADQ